MQGQVRSFAAQHGDLLVPQELLEEQLQQEHSARERSAQAALRGNCLAACWAGQQLLAFLPAGAAQQAVRLVVLQASEGGADTVSTLQVCTCWVRALQSLTMPSMVAWAQ